MPDSQIAITPSNMAVPAKPAAASPAAPESHSGFTFHDFLNIINPLQHIPVVGTIYRELTGDTMKPISNILGGALFGGVIGLATSAVDAIIQETTGKDVGAHVMATLGLHHDHAPKTEVADAAPAKPTMTVRPVPAFLVAEAEADRRAHQAAQTSGAPAASALQLTTMAPTLPQASAPVGTLQPTQFWRSLQRGGAGVTHAGPPAPSAVSVNPSKTLIDAAAATNHSPQGGAMPPKPSFPVAVPTPLLPSASPSTNPAANPPAPPAEAPSEPVAAATPVPAPAAAPQQLATAQPLPRSAIPEMMMQALAKYEAMHRAPQAQAVDQVH